MGKILDNFEFPEQEGHELDGYYALQTEVGQMLFVAINGDKVYKLVADGSMELKRLEIKQAALKQSILNQIYDQLDEAAMRFATEMVRCYRCGRPLTDETSKAKGIGPVCEGMIW